MRYIHFGLNVFLSLYTGVVLATAETNLSIDNRVFFNDDIAIESMLVGEYHDFYYGIGGYVPHDSNVKFDFLVGRRFSIFDETSINLGVGLLEANAYVDYNIEMQLSPQVLLNAGYRFHFDEYSDQRNQFYLGFRFYFNNPSSVRSERLATNKQYLPAPERIIEVQPELPHLEGISFPFDSVSSVNSNELVKLSKWWIENPQRHIVIIGHADSRGPEVYNLKLSKLRATAVAQQLILNGVSEKNITIKGYGENSPIATNLTAEGRSKNRQVEILITD